MDFRYRDDQLAARDAIRAFVRERIVPRAAEWSERGEFPMPLLPELASRVRAVRREPLEQA